MAYQNFIPTVWVEAIDRELEKKFVFVSDCNRKYEGKIKDMGESVKIFGVGKPTIKRISRADRNKDIDAPEEIEDTSVIMYINQMAWFSYMVGDIDKAQASANVMAYLEDETSEALADEMDKYVASFAVDESVVALYGKNPVKVVDGAAGSGEKNVLHILDEAIQKLYENDVKSTTKIVVTVSPRFKTLLKRAYVDLDTNNSKMLETGEVGKYGNVTVKMSNNVHTTSDGAVDNIMIRTQRAVAFAKPLTHTEAFRPERKFADAVKGFILFDAKVVRPKEIININVKYA